MSDPTKPRRSAFHRDILWYFACLVLAILILQTLWFFAPDPVPPAPLTHAYYVWQKQWTDDVRNAVTVADQEAHSFMVLIGEVNVLNGTQRFDPAYPDWASLAKCNSPVTLVLRANASLNDLLQTSASDSARAFVTETFARTIASATEKGLTVRGLQLDYDCPSSKLRAYEQMLAPLAQSFEQYELSITALPAWLKQPGFAALLAPLDYYVLQVHSLEAPKKFSDNITLCNTSRVPGYLRIAAGFDVPFYLALPTYGYLLVFDERDNFAAIYAEGPQKEVPDGYRTRVVQSDVVEIAELIRALNKQHPPTLRGIAWFRLPVASDTLNWTWPALLAVREGRAPINNLTAEVRTPSPGLFEIWITNNGQTDPAREVRITVKCDPRDIIAFDTHNGFRAQQLPTGQTLTGPSPRPGASLLAAWYRAKSTDTLPPTVTVQVP